MRYAISYLICGELALDSGLTVNAVARTRGVAALDHKSADHAVENKSVVKALFRKLDEIIDRLRCFIGIEIKRDLAEILDVISALMTVPKSKLYGDSKVVLTLSGDSGVMLTSSSSKQDEKTVKSMNAARKTEKIRVIFFILYKTSLTARRD